MKTNYFKCENCGYKNTDEDAFVYCDDCGHPICYKCIHFIEHQGYDESICKKCLNYILTERKGHENA